MKTRRFHKLKKEGQKLSFQYNNLVIKLVKMDSKGQMFEGYWVNENKTSSF